MRNYIIALEPWSDQWWADAQALAEAHFEEVDGGIEPRRKFRLDRRIMAGMDQMGCLKLVTVRHEGKMVGYFTWSIMPDVESEGLLIAQQGAWYLAPGHARAAVKSWDFAIGVLKQMGVQCVFPHHRTQGRGMNIGKFFKRRGAKLTQYTYTLWIGEGSHA